MPADGRAEFLDRFCIRIERTVGHSPDDVWRAISEEDQVAVWMEYPTRLAPVIGGQILVDFSPEEPLAGIVVAAEPATRLAYSWGEA